MSDAKARQPVRYRPSFETPEDDEHETQEALVATLMKISRITLEDEGRALRSVHAKSHGVLRGELRVLDGLPEALAQGVFAEPGATYPVVIRLSTSPGDLLDDSVSTPRGLALKIVGVAGDRLPGSEGEVTQDFVMVDGPAFTTPNAKAFLKNLKLLAATTDEPQILKKGVSAILRGAEKLVEAFGSESATLKTLGGHPETHILGETFYTQVPVLYGPYIAKLSIAPVSPNLEPLAGAPLDLKGRPNGIRDAVVEFFRANSAEWEVRVQLCTDIETMPIEDASVVWSEEESPYMPVARISVAPQEAWSDARVATVDTGYAFSPWHGLAAHRPIGSIMRARKAAYETSARFREAHQPEPVREPRGPTELPT